MSTESTERMPWDETWRALGQVVCRDDDHAIGGFESNQRVSYEAAKRNATLAAAAPEMYRMLKAVLDVYTLVYSGVLAPRDLDRVNSELREKATAVLKKARGEK